MKHAWESIQAWAQEFLTADCGGAAVKVCPTCGYLICALGASCGECLPHLERDCRPLHPVACENDACRRILSEDVRVIVADSNTEEPKHFCRFCLVEAIAAESIMPDVQLALTAGALRRMLSTTSILEGRIP